MIARPKRKGAVLSTGRIKRRQKRPKRRLLQAPQQDWDRWERFAKLEGLNWSEFTRRALEQRCTSIADLERESVRTPALRERLPGLDAAAKARRK